MQSSLANKDHFLAIGVMSGTSLDGMDLAAVEIRYKAGSWQYKLLHTANISYSDKWEERLKTAPLMNGEDLTRLHFKYGKYKFVHITDLPLIKLR